MFINFNDSHRAQHSITFHNIYGMSLVILPELLCVQITLSVGLHEPYDIYGLIQEKYSIRVFLVQVASDILQAIFAIALAIPLYVSVSLIKINV